MIDWIFLDDIPSFLYIIFLIVGIRFLMSYVEKIKSTPEYKYVKEKMKDSPVKSNKSPTSGDVIQMEQNDYNNMMTALHDVYDISKNISKDEDISNTDTTNMLKDINNSKKDIIKIFQKY